MDLKDQLKGLFSEHRENKQINLPLKSEFWLQKGPLTCKFEKRKGKPITIIDGYTGSGSDFKALTSKLKKKFNVGGSYKKESIIIQGDYRDQIMDLLKKIGFNVKRVGG